MKKSMKILTVISMLALLLCAFGAVTATAEAPENTTAPAITAEAQAEEAQTSDTGSKAMSAAICVGLAAAAGAIGMGWAIAKAADGISRQPEADGKIRTSLMLGLVFIETAIIYALIIAILIIFVL